MPMAQGFQARSPRIPPPGPPEKTPSLDRATPVALGNHERHWSGAVRGGRSCARLCMITRRTPIMGIGRGKSRCFRASKRRPLPIMHSLRAPDSAPLTFRSEISQGIARRRVGNLYVDQKEKSASLAKRASSGDQAAHRFYLSNSALTIAAHDELGETAHQDAFLAQQRHDLKPWEAPAERLEHQLGLEVGEAAAGAGMHAGAEGKMAVVLALQVEPVGLREDRRVPVGRTQTEADRLPPADRRALEGHVLQRMPEGDLLRAVVAQELRHRRLATDLARREALPLLGMLR